MVANEMQPVFPDTPFKRILILGPSGSGKSTVCKRIGRILDIPIIHLDKHYWNPNWVETPKDEWFEKNQETHCFRNVGNGWKLYFN
ncbi:MAG: hypothetical protein ACFFEV_08730, partial [Candidatus Thorarchaeota archaeon]